MGGGGKTKRAKDMFFFWGGKCIYNSKGPCFVWFLLVLR